MKRRKTYEERSIFIYQQKDESAADAARRLADEWKQGVHPVQLRQKEDRQ